MKIAKLILGCLIGASFFVAACQSEKPSPTTEDKAENASQKDKDWEPEMYEPSELVVLMRQMYEDNQQLKKDILNGENPKEMPASYNNIKTAKATNPDDLKLSYFAMADAYLANYQAIAKAPENERIKTYNNMVQTCIACHQNYCLGPIPKIEKLLIKQ